MKISPELLTELCDALASGCVTYAAAARRVGVSVKTVFRWLKSSSQMDPRFKFEYLGEKMFLHEAIKLSIKLSVMEAEATARRIAVQGWTEHVHFQGRPQFKEREDIIRNGDQDLPADELELRYGQRDVYERDADGNRIPLTITHRPSSQDLALVLRAHLPQLFGDKREININHGGGVLVMSRSGNIPPAPPPATQITGQAVEEIADDSEEIDLDDTPHGLPQRG